ncbi:MAG: FecR domain-containing protein [Candidatus Sericytochromatia bacterium]
MGFSQRVAAAALAAMLMPVPALAQAQEAATVVPLVGEMRGAIAPSSFWRDLKGQTSLVAGDSIKTGVNSAAELILASGGRMTLGANTLVRLQAGPDGLAVRVMAGRLRLTAPPKGTTSVYAGNVRLYGTDTEAVVERADGQWKVAVLAGRIQSQEGDTAPVAVEAGTMMAIESKKTTQIARTTWDDLQVGFPNGKPKPYPPNGQQTTTTTTTTTTTQAPASAVAAAAGGNRWVATGLSTLLPGTGQIYYGELPRGLTYLGLNFALLGTGFYAKSIGQNQIATGAMLGLLGLNVVSPLDAFFFQPKQAEKPQN